MACDLLDAKNLSYPFYKVSRLSPEYLDIFEREQIDVCINAAGNGSVPVSISNPVNDFEANCVDTFKVLDLIRKLSPSTRYLYLSSAAVYGNPKKLPINEDSDINPVSPYGWHKHYGELMCREYFHLYGVKTSFIRPFSVYGPGLRKQLLWDLFLKSKKSKSIELFGTGKETRDFIFIDDLVHAVGTIIDNCEFNASVYNIATGIESEISEIAEVYSRYLGDNTFISFNNKVREGDPTNWRADITRLTNLGFKQTVDLEEGISKTVAWQKEYGLE